MAKISDKLPIIVGVGQSISRWDGNGRAPDPISLANEAVTAAIRDSGSNGDLPSAIDWLAFVRLMQDSVAGRKAPVGRCEDPAATLAEVAGLSPATSIHAGVGGQLPQTLVNEAAAAIWHGHVRVALISGAEAIDAIKTARKSRIELDWNDPRLVTSEDRGLGAPLLTTYEAKNGLGAPLQTYPIFEHALRNRLGLSKKSYMRVASKMLARFSNVASRNPFAFYPGERSEEFLATESDENRAVADPYLKWHVAQDSVNQGSALILTSVGFARKIGIPEERWIYLHGHAEAEDLPVAERPDLSRSKAIELVLDAALAASGLGTEAVTHFDLYSCFPCVPLIASEHLGIDPTVRDVTVTGGLPFFGGPGNNYSSHAIASMVELLRKDRGRYGLVLANGGFMSKAATGVYSTVRPNQFKPFDKDTLQLRIDAQVAVPNDPDAGEINVEGFTVVQGRTGATFGYAIGRTDKGRAIAKVRKGHRATMKNLEFEDPCGRIFKISQESGMSYIDTTDKLGVADSDPYWDRQFNYISVVRNGHILEVTINRPERFNALQGPAHHELHEIFDGFERDPDLWVAILTGAGEKAFCSGNDLKATKEGLDIQPASSGFGGLCERWGREKPVIAAVNGVAMGGGCEIVLACDLAVADPHATLALPEVKVGLFAAAGGVLRLTRQIGRKAAMELILTGRSISAQRALELGIINRIAGEDETALTVAREIAREIILASPTAVRASKRVLNHLEVQIEHAPDAFAVNSPEFLKVIKTNDGKEGVLAFIEKRAPQWTNS